MSSAPADVIIDWLARADGEPGRAKKDWLEQGVALLPMGRTFAAVRLRGEIVHAAVGTDDPGQVAAALEEMLNGPVIRDPRGARDGVYYALIRDHAGLVWDLEDQAPCLGDGVYLGVPALRRVAPPGTYWVLLPHYDGDLCRPQSVRGLIVAGFNRLRPAEC